MQRQKGCISLDKRIGTWSFYWRESGKLRSKRIGSLKDLPTRTAAWRAAKELRHALEDQVPQSAVPTVMALVAQYRVERMPARFSTAYGYNQWLNNHVLPRWGKEPVTALQPRPVELWLKMLELSPKSKVAIRGLISIIIDYAMYRGDIPTNRNPMTLVTIKGASKRTRQPRSLTTDEFQKFIVELEEPFRVLALVGVCFGLRISEALALRWNDVDWLGRALRVERSIVRQRVDDTKTEASQRRMAIDSEMLEELKRWKQTTQFSSNEDWVFASPVKLGRLPWSYPNVIRVFLAAAERADIGRIGTHTMRHTFRSWLDAVGTPIAVQQRLMRHADIRTTMNVYGDVVTDEMSVAGAKVARLALAC